MKKDKLWWVVRGSNFRHLRCKRSDLPSMHTQQHSVIHCHHLHQSHQISCVVINFSFARDNVEHSTALRCTHNTTTM